MVAARKLAPFLLVVRTAALPADAAPVKRVRPSRMSTILLTESWRIRLRLSGFHDLENPDDPDGPLSNAGQPSHLDRVDETQVRNAAAYYRRIGQLAMKLPFRRDQQIAEMVADGAGIRTIKSTLGVGQGRVERVMRLIGGWVPPENWNDEGSDDE